MIEIRNLTFTFPNGAEPALTGVSWDVSESEFVLVGGPSGSGKSTLLRAINGLVPHFSGGSIQGSITVNGINTLANNPTILSRTVGFVGQDPESQTVLDIVEDEIAFALENAAIPPAEMRIRVEETLDLVNLTSLRSRPVNKLSGGERQRLAIACALSLRPAILVLDEPTSQLDPQSAEDVLRALVRLNEDLGLTIILAEHRLERILRYVDRVTYLEAGQIKIDAPVRDALKTLPIVPPLIELARTLGWQPLPVNIREAKAFIGPGDYQKNVGSSGPASDQGQVANVAQPLLQIEGLSFSYNGQKTLTDVSLSLMPGEVLALIGRNGAGKSTLLKCVVGLITPGRGKIVVNGRSTTGRDVADICRDVAYLPQYPDDLLFAESVVQEFQETLHNHNLPESTDVSQLIAQLGLQGLENVYPRDLSVGQRQRVALGAVTITRPRVMLFDEPTRGLDARSKAALVDIWRSWLAEGAGILLVTHDVELVAQLAARTIVLSQGEVIAAGDTREVLNSSPHFGPQISRLFPGSGWLTLQDALRGLSWTPN